MTNRQICYEIQNLIINDCKRNISQRKITEKYEVSKSAVRKRYKKFLNTVVDQPGRGRKRSRRDDIIINKNNKRKRLEFARKYANQPVEFWKRILWTDESKFELLRCKQRFRVRRKTGEELEDRHLQKTVKYDGGSIMVWSWFSWEGVGQIVKIDDIMTADIYINILRENLEVSLIQLGLDNNFILQQDNDPKHTAKRNEEIFNFTPHKTA